jgi:hypothetical protein
MSTEEKEEKQMTYKIRADLTDGYPQDIVSPLPQNTYDQSIVMMAIVEMRKKYTGQGSCVIFDIAISQSSLQGNPITDVSVI